MTDAQRSREDPSQAALDLWREWFKTDPQPRFIDGIYGRCFFCGDIELEHAADCIYVRAKRLVEGEAANG